MTPVTKAIQRSIVSIPRQYRIIWTDKRKVGRRTKVVVYYEVGASDRANIVAEIRSWFKYQSRYKLKKIVFFLETINTYYGPMKTSLLCVHYCRK